MKQKIYFIVLISSTVLFSCNQENKTTSISTSSGTEHSIDTTKVYTSGSVLGNDKGVTSILKDVTGAPLLPENTISFEDNNWANNLDDLVGRVIKIQKDESGNITKFELKKNITLDSVKAKIEVPSSPAKDEKIIDKSKGGDLKFLGIEINLTDKQKYEYINLMTLFTRIKDNQVDKSKIPSQYKCDDCGYYYINSASVRVIETTKYTEKGKKISVSDLSSFGVAKPIDGKIYTTETNKDYQKFNRVFITTLSLPE